MSLLSHVTRGEEDLRKWSYTVSETDYRQDLDLLNSKDFIQKIKTMK